MTETPPSTAISRKSWISLAAVLFVQTQNAFNDNFVKMVLIGLGLAAARGVTAFGIDLGEKIQFILTALIPLPFILAAPVSGWLSDRFSKKQVLVGALLLQLAVFVLILVALLQRQVLLAVFGYFLLALQSTIFSPAKQGILKELVGSSRLGFANGLMQMLTMIGILGGIGLGGWSFDHLLAWYNEANGVSADSAWRAAMWPTVIAGAACLLPLAAVLAIQPVPSHPGERFSPSIWWSHFSDLRSLWRRPAIRVVAAQIGLYWFIANFVGLVFVSFGLELFPDTQKGGAASATSLMMLFVGLGLAVGSTAVSILSRSRIRLRLIPLGGFGMAAALLGIALFDPAAWSFADASSWAFKASAAAVGFASGFFVVPLSARLQDLAPEDERGRIISASNLINAFAGIAAIAVCSSLDSLKLSAAVQTLVLALAMAGGAFWTTSYLRGKRDPSA